MEMRVWGERGGLAALGEGEDVRGVEGYERVWGGQKGK